MLLAIILILLIPLGISVYNYFTAPGFSPIKFKLKSSPLISVLIPARNEENNIGRCLDGLLKQDYKNLEVLVGNDHSDDKTPDIINKYVNDSKIIKRVDIPPLPEGWKGKNFAAFTLYKESKGEIILFIDADVVIEEETVSSAAGYLNKFNAGILSVFPRQEMLSFGEKIIVPLLNFFLLALLPLIKVYNSKKVSFSAGIGQFLMFKREAYEVTGGHLKVKNKIAEDLELIRIGKQNNIKVLSLIDNGLISCRMYTSFSDAVNGFSKNFFKGSALPRLSYILLITVFFAAFFIPFILIFINVYYIIPVLIIICIRLMISLISSQPKINLFIHPIQMLAFYFIGLNSVFYGSKIKWKGR